jgi:hypothetical protein
MGELRNPDQFEYIVFVLLPHEQKQATTVTYVRKLCFVAACGLGGNLAGGRSRQSALIDPARISYSCVRLSHQGLVAGCESLDIAMGRTQRMSGDMCIALDVRRYLYG